MIVLHLPDPVPARLDALAASLRGGVVRRPRRGAAARVAPARHPEAHGTVVAVEVASAGQARAAAAAWGGTRAGADATLLVIPTARTLDVHAVGGALLAGLAEGGATPDAVADIVVLDDAPGDDERDALLAGADAVMEVPRPPAAGPAGGRPPVRLEGSVFGAHSLAAVNRGLARALLADGAVDLTLANTEGAVLDPAAPVDPGIRSLVDACVRDAAADPRVVVRHGHPADLGPGPGGARVVAILPWEFGRAPRRWLAALGVTVDEVWTPSTLTRDGWIAAGADPARVAVVPNGVDPVAMTPAAPPLGLGEAAPGFRFLYVGGLAWRKGTDLLVEAYRLAFGPEDDVTLVVKDFGPGGPYPPDAADRLVDELAADPGAARVLRLSGPMPETALPGLYTACHSLVHPYRAEAYGMTMAEAMACGLCVVAPSAGAARDFMDPAVALLVPARRVAMPGTAVAGEDLGGAPVVHEVDVEDLAATMRWAYENREAAAALGRAASVRMHAGHTWAHAAAVAAPRLAALATGATAPAPAAATPAAA